MGLADLDGGRLIEALDRADSADAAEAEAGSRMARVLLAAAGVAVEDLIGLLCRAGGTVAGPGAAVAELERRLAAQRDELAAAHRTLDAAVERAAQTERRVLALTTEIRLLRERLAGDRKRRARTPEQRRLEMLAILGTPGGARLSDREIARRIGVAPSTVGRWRRQAEKGA